MQALPSVASSSLDKLHRLGGNGEDPTEIFTLVLDGSRKRGPRVVQLNSGTDPSVKDTPQFLLTKAY
ncbi:uncharacterized protein METZ01_LOCUS46629 [marine metagenome]|uniref:Uncharacterized protein n=1 Tax=marine metagenome TaxID=408172 RepID=A0A381RPH1_9ZZZZ